MYICAVSHVQFLQKSKTMCFTSSIAKAPVLFSLLDKRGY